MRPWNRLSLRARVTLFSILFLAILITLYVAIESFFSVFRIVSELQGRIISLVVVLTGMILSSHWLAVIILKPVKRMSETAAGITATTLHKRLEIDQLHDELKKLGVVFNTMMDGLEHSFKQQARFVSAAAHELRTPLSILRTNLEVAGDGDGIDPSDWRDYRATTERTLSRLESLTEDLLLLADGTYDQTHSEHKVVELASILADAKSFMEPMAVKYGVTLHLMEPCDALVKGEEGFLFLVFRNLLDNAIRYNRPNGNVTLEVSQEDERVVVRVSDTGKGISPPSRELVFERFYRLESSRARSHGGAGLGLSIVRHLLAIFQGTVELESSSEFGSVFKVTLIQG
ncbi:ATP-binding protein [Paenibacillus chondroitinus]|uniref:histidine kinase n=1 Tax=Paenibacillus chondroitinus TaxID=59842 RepID=A0ABU6D4R9_9BACL|nr:MULTISPECIES: ATP-binding protein [Paenibacillus]MCY9660762.1 ATP-binding protein [Paenibacillus anseongense]MEB4792440.1 ATP-binding protein [Paenibacillus chondroitinus]